MDVSKYVATGNEIKTLGLKLQTMLDPNADPTQVISELKEKEMEKHANDKSANAGAVVIGLVLSLILGTFILLHFW